MNTFEKVYKEKLEQQLMKFTDKFIVISNDINFSPLEKNKNNLVMIIRSGAGVRSSKEGYDLTTQTFTIDLITEINDLQQVLGSVNSFINHKNGKWDTLKIDIYDPDNQSLDTKTFDFKPVFTTPFPAGNPFDIMTKTETIKAIAISLSITVGYSSTACIKPEKFYLKIGNETYYIDTTRYEKNFLPTYAQEELTDKRFLKQKKVADVITFTFVLLKKKNDVLHNLLSNEFTKKNEESLINQEIKLITESNAIIDIQTINITETYEAGATIIILTLGR